MTLRGVREHQEAFQEIADENDDPFYPGTRAAGTEGYDDSVRYVAGLLRRAGYRRDARPRRRSTFNFPATLRQLTPVQAEYETGVFTGSGSGTVQGRVVPVDINLTPPRASTSGCEAADFAGLDWSGPADIALVQRGTCNFGDKAFFAEQAGAEAVIIFNQGNTPDREELIVADASSRTDGTPVEHGIPVVGASFARRRGAGPAGLDRVRRGRSRPRPATDYNVIAEKEGKNDDNVVMAGAHLDSVIEGPGINDNGSGSAALLETALMMAKVKPQNTIRFGWWAAEEQGLVGSDGLRHRPVAGRARPHRPVHELRHGRLAELHLHGVRRRRVDVPGAGRRDDPAGLDGDRGPLRVRTTPGSTSRTRTPSSRVAATTRRSSDNGIPSGGLFTGAEEIKTAEQQAIWGGVAGEQFDQCYHEACDDIDNVDLHALRVNSDLIAFAQLTFAYSTESVNGVRGKRVPGRPVRLPAPAGPEGTFAGEDGGHGPHGAGS